MERRPGIRGRFEEAKRRSGGDCFNIANDRVVLECLVKATKGRLESDRTAEARERYETAVRLLEEFDEERRPS